MRFQIVTTSDYVDFRVDFQYLQPSSVTDDYSRHGSPIGYVCDAKYRKLHLTGYARPGEPANNWDVYFDDLSTIRTHEAELLFKTLKEIDRKLTKAQDKSGYPVDFADYAARLSTAIGVDVMLLIHSESGRARTGYRWDSHDMGGHAVNQMRLAITNALKPIESPSEELAIA